MSLKIKNINIKAFRGIPCCDLPLNKNSLLLIGENGTGKSSIVDALEFFFTGNLDFIKRTQGITLRDHLPHKDYSIEDVKIEITFTGDKKLIRTFKSSPSNPPNFNDYFETAINGTFILRRKQLLKFIDVSPSDRFKAITNLIGIEPLTKIETETRKAKNILNKEVNQKRGHLDDIIQDISKIVGQKINTTEDVLPILNNLLEENKLPLIKSFEGVSEHNEKMFRFTKSSNKVDMFQTLQEIINKSKNNVIKSDMCNRVTDLHTETSQLMKNNLQQTVSLIDTLKTGKTYLKNEKTVEVCPLCKQKVNRELLLEQIERRYKNLEEITIKISNIKKKRSEVATELKDMITDFKVIISKLDLMKEMKTDKECLLKEISFLEKLEKEFENKDLQIPSDNFVKESKKINKILNIIINKSISLESEIELNEEEKKFLEFVEKITQATSKIEDLKKADKNLKITEGYFENAEKIYDKFSTLKRAKIQNIFNSIKTDLQKYYSFIHPNDPHKNINLAIPEEKETSVVLKMESFGRPKEDPRAFTSEGHLDTLGLCIFLAFEKRFNQNCSLVVLDDIVTTVDSSHRESICRLLFEEFKEKQFIITTHDGLWYKQMIALINAYGLENNFLKWTIYNWNEKNGPSIRSHKFRWESIPEKIKLGEKTCAGNEIRQYLEWVLESTCKSTGAKLPLSDHGYTVNNLIDPARLRLKDLIKDEETNKKIQDSFKEINKSIMGNLLSHHNELASNASIQDVKRLFKAVRKIHKLVSCPSCGRFLKYEYNADRLICSKNCSQPVIIETK